ncbi:MAG TPA: DUF1800 family protein [Anaeromyxobacteraceae bacterium]|nr:DUF1800 family protein [Anaeromyxobacteraceae bacterium]
MADLSPKTSWTADDAAHLARRAGFGISPEAASALAAQSLDAAVNAWVDGGADRTEIDAVLGATADVVDEPARSASTTAGAVDAPAVPAPHPFLVQGNDAWRNNFSRAQAYLAFRMQYDPYPFAERMALFFHNLFATGWTKVNNAALMLDQYQTFRDHGLDNFDDLLVLVSKDPAMAIWLDLVANDASGSNVANENYAREVMELYSLGADNGYNQTDITQLARALSGWSFTVDQANAISDPTNPNSLTAAAGNFRVYDGSANPDEYLWYMGAAAHLPSMHGAGTITYLGQTFDIANPPSGMVPGEDALRSIVTSRATQCSQFLAQRLIIHFVTGNYAPSDLTDVAAMIRSAGFNLRSVMKTLLKSNYFFDAANRFALVEGPVSWTVRAARALGYDLATADAMTPKGFPAWSSVTDPYFEQAGMKLLDPIGPNGWKEDTGWMNSNTIRYRTMIAAAVALGAGAPQSSDAGLFPSDATRWFPTEPATPQDVLARMVALLQPAPIPTAVSDSWLQALWPSGFSWNATDPTMQASVRELAYLILCSPGGQVY